MPPVLGDAIEEALKLGHDAVTYSWPHQEDDAVGWKPYELDLIKYVQTNTQSGATHPIRRVRQCTQVPTGPEKKKRKVDVHRGDDNVEDRNGCLCHEWQIWLNGQWWPLSEDMQKAMSLGAELGQDVVEYVWHYPGKEPRFATYQLDLKKLVQKNLDTGTTRCLRFAEPEKKKHKGAEDGHGPLCYEWQIWLNGEWWPLGQELQQVMRAGLEKGDDLVEYVWQYPGQKPGCTTYHLDLKNLLQQNMDTGTRRQIRFAESWKKKQKSEVHVDTDLVDDRIGLRDEWQIWLHHEWMPLSQELQKALCDGAQKGHDVVSYVWHYAGQEPEWITYELDLKKFCQKNLHTGTTRSIRLVTQPVQFSMGSVRL